jgi:hypothetical protein
MTPTVDWPVRRGAARIEDREEGEGRREEGV